ncbi:uncharacterized protein LOC143034562 [Oratosquilla oratoria]|uniref:uncharacterized protein LOC143034562 n=1 Tax=Oratosquilla oratoria TaxID=337810 RepID=UPI003F760F7A
MTFFLQQCPILPRRLAALASTTTTKKQKMEILRRMPGTAIACTRSITTNRILLAKASRATPGIELEERNWQYEFYQKDKGKIYDKKPFKMTIEKGKMYRWCTCGNSKTQPLCDLTHLNQHLKINLKPVIFKAPKTMEVWLCNCKQTNNRPFCDGSHRSEDVQIAVKS